MPRKHHWPLQERARCVSTAGRSFAPKRYWLREKRWLPGSLAKRYWMREKSLLPGSLAGRYWLREKRWLPGYLAKRYWMREKH